jgi:hypothetical protein
VKIFGFGKKKKKKKNGSVSPTQTSWGLLYFRIISITPILVYPSSKNLIAISLRILFKELVKVDLVQKSQKGNLDVFFEKN